MHIHTPHFITAALVAVLAAGCGQSYEEQRRATREQRAESRRQDSLALKIATTPTLDCLPLFVAADDSLFARAGVDVRLRERANRMEGDTLVRAGRVEGLATDTALAARLAQGGTTLVTAATTPAAWQLITNRRARITRAEQLADKMVAAAPHTADAALADRIIAQAKPKQEVYRITVMNEGVRLRMMLNNEVDAAVLTEPQATAARQRGHRTLATSRQLGMRPGVLAFTRRALADKRRQGQLRRFARAYNLAVDSINRLGPAHFAAVIMRHMHVDRRTATALPRTTFTHASADPLKSPATLKGAAPLKAQSKNPKPQTGASPRKP